ncbi:MAG: NAD-dependent deacylase [Bacteroidales bacterium]|nr:NAD-dependent deacylase [Bacteroidales bacterium]MCF8403442.1 NAD-dependent deacylase [Bacteroidales bacterium]
MDQSLKIKEAAEILKQAKYAISFTGAGISVESGVPPFRGENGIWNQYDPSSLELDFFHSNPKESWKVIRELFYKFFGDAKANPAHIALAKMEEKGLIKCVITQNIDNLHQQAGSKNVYEFHGNSQKLVCTRCDCTYTTEEVNFENLPPYCKCGGLIKPDFIFFGEGIPHDAYNLSMEAASNSDVVIVVGSTGEIMPAAQIPHIAKRYGAFVIEINPNVSKFTHTVTDLHLKGKAGDVLTDLYAHVFNDS